MKRYTIQTLVPALALLAVGCSTPTAMQSTEYDDMYYSSSDKTEYVQPEATAQATDEYETEEAVTNRGVINPEYSDDRAVLRDYDGDEYYDGRSYDPRDNWYRPNYSFVDPYWGSAYTPMYANRYYGYSRMADPFYDPFYYDPFYYDSFYNPYRNPYMRSGLSVTIAYGSVWGNPYWGSPYGRYYNNWYPYNSYYNGFYQGYYYGRNQYIYDRPGYVQTRKVQYGPRTERSRVVAGGSNDGTGRPDRGTLSSDKQQQAVTPATGRNERPSRTNRTGTTTDTRKDVIRTQPDVNRPARQQRRGNTPAVEQENVVPAERVQPIRQRREYTPPSRETRQPVRQEVRPINVRRESSTPVRQAPVRSSYERSEVRPAPVRSSSSSSGSSSGSSSERRSGGRPTRGGN